MGARGRCLGLAAWAIVLAALSTPATGSASPAPIVLPRGLGLEMVLEGSSGYTVTVSGSGHRHVEVLARRGPYFASYRVRGSVSRDHVEADLGRFGRVSVRFEGSARTRPEPFREECEGRRPIYETGWFRGTVEFEGEDGFTAVSARRARGSLYRTFRQVCRPRPGTVVALALPSRRRRGEPARAGAPAPAFAVTILSAGSRSGGRATYFEAFRLDREPGARRPSPWLITAGLSERIGRVSTGKFVLTEARPAEIRVSARGVHPAAANVALGGPFAGTASFREAGDEGPGWAGDLSLSLPGAGATALAGDQFDAVLCRALGIRQLGRCLATAWTRGSAQISGSQSQLFGDARLSWSR